MMENYDLFPDMVVFKILLVIMLTDASLNRGVGHRSMTQFAYVIAKCMSIMECMPFGSNIPVHVLIYKHIKVVCFEVLQVSATRGLHLILQGIVMFVFNRRNVTAINDDDKEEKYRHSWFARTF
jgi:hypothetical protein